MDARRLNTLLEICGLAGALLVKLAPLIPPGHTADIIALILAFAGGVGVRSRGTEYTDVAEAKAEAKIMTRVVASLAPPELRASLNAPPQLRFEGLTSFPPPATPPIPPDGAVPNVPNITIKGKT